MFPVINHLIAQNPGIQTALSHHVGRRFRIRGAGFSLTALIDPSGYLKATDEAETTISFRPSAIQKLLNGFPPGVGDLNITGDHALGMALLPLLAQLRYRAEHDIDRLFGKEAAAWAVQTREDILNDYADLSRHLYATVSNRVRNAAQPLALHREILQYFADDLARLRDDTARLEARIRLLEQRGG